ncbi:MAG: MBL fold metallo-hydrolase [Planctomycetes bacterium]|nr:MBL fold metallo-hydrolase [Planctomycetota bacterium]
MSLFENLLANLEGFSLAKYSTWFFYGPDHVLLDCGEGVSTTLTNRIYAIERILLSHGHGDHVAGIPGFLYSRASSMGDTAKPLAIYYPRGDSNIDRLRKYIAQILPNPPYPLSWIGTGPGERIELPVPNRHVRTFPTVHLQRGASLGYAVVESRSRLKKEFAALSQKEIVAVVREKGRDYLTETYEKNLLVYSGDSMPLPPALAEEAEVLLHEATFLDPGERDLEIHSTVVEALRVAIEARVSSLVLFHLSTRYGKKDVKDAIQSAVAAAGTKLPVYYTFPRGLPTSFQRVQ